MKCGERFIWPPGVRFAPHLTRLAFVHLDYSSVLQKASISPLPPLRWFLHQNKNKLVLTDFPWMLLHISAAGPDAIYNNTTKSHPIRTGLCFFGFNQRNNPCSPLIIEQSARISLTLVAEATGANLRRWNKGVWAPPRAQVSPYFYIRGVSSPWEFTSSWV